MDFVVGGVRHHELHRHEGAAVEFEQVGGRILDQAGDGAAGGAVLVDHGGPDEFVHPQLVGVVDRLAEQHDIAKRIGGVAIVHPLEYDEPRTLVRTCRTNLERATGGLEHGPGVEALGSV